jgi:hypothetical protein
MHFIGRLKSIVWTIAVLLCHTVNVHAQEHGWYVGGGAGFSVTDLDEGFWSDDSVTSSEIDNSGIGFNLYGGYRMHRHFALEVGYLRFADTEFTGFSNGLSSIWIEGPIEGHAELQGITMQAVGLWPLFEGDLELFIKGGMFMWDTLAYYSETINDIHRFNDDGGTLIGGMGAEVRVWGEWRLRGEMQLTSVIFANRETVPAGIATIGLVHSLN